MVSILRTLIRSVCFGIHEILTTSTQTKDKTRLNCLMLRFFALSIRHASQFFDIKGVETHKSISEKIGDPLLTPHKDSV